MSDNSNEQGQQKDKRFIVPWRIILECIAILVAVLPLFVAYVIIDKKPYMRGFFCDDETIKHPVKEDTISNSTAFIIWFLIVMFIVPSVECLYIFVHKWDTYPKIRFYCHVPWLLIELYRVMGLFALGVLFTLLTTEIAKFSVGRLRPYFLTLCNANLTDEVCKDVNGLYKYVVDVRCPLLPNTTEKEHMDARKSFLSGHASISFYCAVFLAVYMHSRLSKSPPHKPEDRARRITHAVVKALKVLRPFAQFGLFALAFWITLTRISDYKHHPTDVITGIIVGTLFALLVLLALGKIFNRPTAEFSQMKEATGSGDYNAEDNQLLSQVGVSVAAAPDDIHFADETPPRATTTQRAAAAAAAAAPTNTRL